MSGSISRRVGDLPLSKGHGKHSLYHLCLAEHDEVLFRDDSDYIYFLNTVATEAAKECVSVRAFACMSDHVHLAVWTDDVELFAAKVKFRYTRYFNNKYHRSGALISDTFMDLVYGHNHEEALYSYIIRNPRHHNMSPSPLSYPYASGRYYFRAEFGFDLYETYIPRKARPQISRKGGNIIDSTWQVLPDGLLDPSCWLDVHNVESCFVTQRHYVYQILFRKSGVDWVEEQKKDAEYSGFVECQDVTLDTIEPQYISTKEKMLSNEKAEFKRPRFTDMDVCRIVDRELVPKYGKASYAELARSEKVEMANDLLHKFDVFSVKQIARVLALKQ